MEAFLKAFLFQSSSAFPGLPVPALPPSQTFSSSPACASSLHPTALFWRANSHCEKRAASACLAMSLWALCCQFLQAAFSANSYLHGTDPCAVWPDLKSVTIHVLRPDRMEGLGHPWSSCLTDPCTRISRNLCFWFPEKDEWLNQDVKTDRLS